MKRSVQKEEKLEKECVKMENDCLAQKIFTGVTDEARKNKRYVLVFKLISYFEDKLNGEKLDFQIELNYSTLEALYKSMYPDYDLEEVIEKFDVLTPKNFFRVLYDINAQKYYSSSKMVAEKYLMCTSVLEELNEFYNEYSDIFMRNIGQNYSSLYLFNILYQNRDNSYLFNAIYDMAKNDEDVKKRHFAAGFINEYENEIKRNDSTSSSKETLGYEADRVAKNLGKIMENLNLNVNHRIDDLFISLG